MNDAVVTYLAIQIASGAWIVKRTTDSGVAVEVHYLTHPSTGLVVLTRSASHAVAAELQEEGEPSGLLKAETFESHDPRSVRPL